MECFFDFKQKTKLQTNDKQQMQHKQKKSRAKLNLYLNNLLHTYQYVQRHGLNREIQLQLYEMHMLHNHNVPVFLF